jgi:hypothetical protein
MEKSLTDLLISGFTSVIALTIGHHEEPVVNIKTGAIFPTATYQFLRATNASDPSTYRNQGIADIIADVMPNGREVISLFIRRLSSAIPLHAHDLHINSGLPIAISRASNPDEGEEPLDAEPVSTISAGPASVGRREEQGGRREEKSKYGCCGPRGVRIRRRNGRQLGVPKCRPRTSQDS